jgi:hypothetical protein
VKLGKPRDKVILYVARFVSAKEQIELIRWFHTLKVAIPDAACCSKISWRPREVIMHGVEGFLADDEEFLSYAVRMLKVEHETWAKMQKNTVRRASEFTPERFAGETLKHLEKPIGAES